MQKDLNDGKKSFESVSDPKTSFNSPNTLIKQFEAYCCFAIGYESGCDMSLIDYLKTIIYITDDEIKVIYNKDYLG